MNIKQTLDEILDQINAFPDGKLGQDLKAQAILAILGGPTSYDWETYMKNFAGDDDDALNRLTLKDDASKNDPWVRIQIVYMVSYATCGPTTLTTTGQLVTNEVIDQ